MEREYALLVCLEMSIDFVMGSENGLESVCVCEWLTAVRMNLNFISFLKEVLYSNRFLAVYGPSNYMRWVRVSTISYKSNCKYKDD